MCPSLSPKDQYTLWIGVPRFVLCKNGCQRTNGPNGNKKDMCRLKSYGDRISRSPMVHPWVLKATWVLKLVLYLVLKLNDDDLHCRSPS